MIIVEYRVPMPFSADEYRIGQLYTIARKSKLESADAKNGVKINANEPYSGGPGGCGQYTNKTYYLTNKIPDWMKRLLPTSAAKLNEEAWNAYPYSKNRFTNPLFDKLTLEIESKYIDGGPTLTNVFDLGRMEEEARTIQVIDLANDRYRGKKAQDEHQHLSHFDVLQFNPLFRAPITQSWLQEYELAYESNNNNNDTTAKSNHKNYNDEEPEPRLMTCYKLCRVSFPIWPIQNKVEQFIQQYCRDTILESHRQAWLWQDDWTGMSMDDIRAIEKDTQSHLMQMMMHSSIDKVGAR